MKFTSSALVFLFTSSAMAFAPQPNVAKTSAAEKTASARSMSDRPIFSPPEVLDGELAGDYRFDPLNFSQNKQDLSLYREAEIRHARLAMLAAVGWPLAEVYNSQIATQFDLPTLIRPNDLAPAVLNGNISDVSPLFFIAALTLGAMIEAHTLQRQAQGTPAKFIGDIGFDPLNAYPSDNRPDLQRAIQESELANGRLAMLAVTGYAVAEAIQHVGIIDSTPQFF